MNSDISRRMNAEFKSRTVPDVKNGAKEPSPCSELACFFIAFHKFMLVEFMGGIGYGGVARGDVFWVGILVLLLTVTLLPPQAMSAAGREVAFQDIKGHQLEQSIAEAVKQGWVKGVGPAEFMPDRKVSRAEFAAMVVRALPITPSGAAAVYSDVTREDWYYPAVAAISGAGVVNGYPGGRFGPHDNLTAGQAADIVTRLFIYSEGMRGAALFPRHTGLTADWTWLGLAECLRNGRLWAGEAGKAEGYISRSQAVDLVLTLSG